MHGSKLFEVLKAFDQKELLQLHRFLQSPFFSQSRSNESVLKLFEFILPHASAFADPRLTKENAYAHLFPGKAYQKGQLEKMMSLLLKEIFRFITYYNAKLGENETSILLNQARFFREKKMDKFFNKAIDQVKKVQRKASRRNKEFYFHQYLVEKEISEFESLFNTRKEELNIPNTLQSLEVFYLLSKLEYICWFLSQNLHFTSQHLQNTLDELEEVLPKLTQKEFFQIPLIQAYTYAVLLLQGKDEENSFSKLKQLVEQYEDQIPLEQLKALQALTRNYCVVKYNSGELKYFEVAFKLYRLHLEKGYLFYQGGLLPSTIRNLVTTGLKLKEYTWVYNFLESSKDKITGTKHPRDVYHFNLACYHFALQQYEQALELLADKYEDIYYRIAAKRLEIMIYFEQDSPLTDSRLDAFKVFIFRISKRYLSYTQREINNGFADLLKQIMNPKTKGNDARIAKLIQKIEAKKIVSDKQWLLEKLHDLSSKPHR